MKFLKTFSILASAATLTTVVACGTQTQNSTKKEDDKSKQKQDTSNNNTQQKITNQTIDPTKYGVAKLADNINTRRLLHPAQRGENFSDVNGVFKIQLHLTPVQGVTGEWIALATEVKGDEDNTLVNPSVVKVAKTTAVTDEKAEYKLTWTFDGENKLKENSFYTFTFYKVDGTDRILFGEQNIDNNLDIFDTKISNQAIDPTKYGVTKLADNINTRRLLHPAQRGENFSDVNGVFKIQLHLTPVQGVTGEWIALATEVKGDKDNTLVDPSVVKVARATAVTDEKAEYKLTWTFDGDNKLKDNAFYTFTFYKVDGTDRILFGQENIDKNLDIFYAKAPTKNVDLDVTIFGLPKLSENIDKDRNTRRLLFPAQRGENRLDENGVFNIKLHHSPVEGLTGDWVAIATRVKGDKDNTLVSPLNFKVAETKADPNDQFTLRFAFDGKNKLDQDAYYTFLFYKKDGTQRVLFSQDHINNNIDIFESKLP